MSIITAKTRRNLLAVHLLSNEPDTHVIHTERPYRFGWLPVAAALVLIAAIAGGWL